jgi:hypothetical protein
MLRAKQVDTFQYSCLTPKDMSANKYTDFVTVLYQESLNSTSNTLSCPSSQYLVINSVRPEDQSSCKTTRAPD